MRVAVTGGAGDIGARARGLLDGGRHPHARIFTRPRVRSATVGHSSASPTTSVVSAAITRNSLCTLLFGAIDIPAWVMGRI